MYRRSKIWNVPKWTHSLTTRSKQVLWWKGTSKNITSLIICNLLGGKIAPDIAIDQVMFSRILTGARICKNLAAKDKLRPAEKFTKPSTLWRRKQKLILWVRLMIKILIRKLTHFMSMKTTTRVWTTNSNLLMMTMKQKMKIYMSSLTKWPSKLHKSVSKPAVIKLCRLIALWIKVSGLPFSYNRASTPTWGRPLAQT